MRHHTKKFVKKADLNEVGNLAVVFVSFFGSTKTSQHYAVMRKVLPRTSLVVQFEHSGKGKLSNNLEKLLTINFALFQANKSDNLKAVKDTRLLREQFCCKTMN